MRIFIALFSGETADLSVSAKKMYNGMNMKRTIKPPNIEARNIVLLGNKNDVIHQKINRNRNNKSTNVLGLRNCSVWSNANPSSDLGN